MRYQSDQQLLQLGPVILIASKILYSLSNEEVSQNQNQGSAKRELQCHKKESSEPRVILLSSQFFSLYLLLVSLQCTPS